MLNASTKKLPIALEKNPKPRLVRKQDYFPLGRNVVTNSLSWPVDVLTERPIA